MLARLGFRIDGYGIVHVGRGAKFRYMGFSRAGSTTVETIIGLYNLFR